MESRAQCSPLIGPEQRLPGEAAAVPARGHRDRHQGGRDQDPGEVHHEPPERAGRGRLLHLHQRQPDPGDEPHHQVADVTGTVLLKV